MLACQHGDYKGKKERNTKRRETTKRPKQGKRKGRKKQHCEIRNMFCCKTSTCSVSNHHIILDLSGNEYQWLSYADYKIPTSSLLQLAHWSVFGHTSLLFFVANVEHGQYLRFSFGALFKFAVLNPCRKNFHGRVLHTNGLQTNVI
jgi:mRNA-degrading endonuclease HigB of HigAB toxin-antitoxin module